MRKLIYVLMVLALSLAACAPPSYNSSADYFDGSVLVEYYQTRMRGHDDSMTITFNDKGNYEVHFSYTEGFENSRFNNPDKAPLPEDFTFTVTDGPRTKVITQYILPGFLTVTITHNGRTESHDFK